MPVQGGNHRHHAHLGALCLVSLLFTVVTDRSQAAKPAIRGLDPSLSAKYKLKSGRFSCFDGSSELAFDRVNDNFCDCIDGSDEPGTSACPAGQFYCRNKGHQPLLLNSSSVDDGFCDCCDGTDESSGACPNTCAEAGSANRAALKSRWTAFKFGLKSRENYVVDVLADKRKWEQEIAILERRESELVKTVAKLQARKERVEKQEARERTKEEAARKKRESEEAAVKEAEPEAVPEAPLAGEEVTEEAVEPVADAPTDEALTAENEGTAEAEGEEELSEEEKGRRIAAQWTHDPAATAQPGISEDDAEDTESEAAEIPHVPKYDPPQLNAEPTDLEPGTAEDTTEDEDAVEPAKGFIPAATAWLYSKLGWEYSPMSQTTKYRQRVKDEYNAQNEALKEVTKQRTDLDRKLKLDAGPDDVFLALADKCFTATIEKYVYEVCPFASAAQKDGGMSTSLGSWKGFEGGYRFMVFENGQHCWNGPLRSMRVELECGYKEEISHVQEPSRCEYTALMATPAACSREETALLEEQVAAAERELAGKDEL